MSQVQRPGAPGENSRVVAESHVGFEPRDGDVLVVSYGEVKVPLSVQYSVATVGGYSYSRSLREGDDVDVIHDRIYEFLRRKVEQTGQEKIRTWVDAQRKK